MKRFAMSFTLVLVVAACSSGPPEPPPPPPFTPAGVFDITIDAMGTEMAGSMTIEGMDGAYTGSLTIDLGTVALTDFAVDGMEVTFAGTTPQFSIEFTLTFEGDGFTGALDLGDIGTGSITGVKR